MRILKTLILVFLAIQLQAQQFSWGVPVKHDPVEFSGKAHIQRYLLEESKDGLLRLRVERDEVMSPKKITVEKYDANLELQKTKEIVSGYASPKAVEEVIVGNKQIYIFFSKADLSTKTNTLTVEAYDFDGEALGEEKTLEVITDLKTLSVGQFFIAASQDRKHFMTLANPVFQKKVNEVVQIKTFDATFKEVFAKSFTLDYQWKRFIFNTPYIMNDGTPFLYKHQKVPKIGEVKELYRVDKTAGTLKAMPLKLTGDAEILMIDNTMLQNSKGNFVYAGLQKAAKGFAAAKGIFYLEFDKNGKFVKEVIEDFKDAPKLGFTGLKIKKVELLDNDELLFLAHQLDESLVAGSDPNNRAYTYIGNDIFVMRINGSDVVWSQIIKRERMETQADRGRLLDFIWHYDKEGDNLVVLYNDFHYRYMKNQQATTYKIPMLAYIAKDGLYSNKPLLTTPLGKYTDSYTFCTDEFYQRGSYLIVKCTNNIDFKLGRFSL